MTDAVLPQKGATQPPHVPDVTLSAERALTRALELCAAKMGLDGPHTAAHHVRQGNAVARMYFCSGMAKQVAESLGASEQNVRAICAPDYDVLFQDLCSRGKARDEWMVRLLVWTRCKTSELDSLVIAWRRALLEVYRDTVGSDDKPPLLDVQIIDDADVEQHFRPGRGEGRATRLAVYWMAKMNQVVDIVYERESLHR